MPIKETNYSTRKNILLAPALAYAVPVVVNSTNVTANAQGKKIIPAGTCLGAAKKVLDEPNTVLSAVVDNTAQGILLYDVDVTDGSANATLLVSGVVDTSKFNYATLVPAAAKTVLTHIIFRNGEYD